VALGRALRPRREKGVLIAGCGALIHNLEKVRYGERAVDAWAAECDRWLSERLDAGEVEELLGYAEKAPHARLAAPTPEHFLPLFFALGAAEGELPRSYFHAIRHGSGLLCAMSFGA
jgi:4,5-DOPA dioxygenase extradiol